MRYDESDREVMTQNLARFVATPLEQRGLKRAAVGLIVTDDGEGGAALVLTRRAAKLNSHSGQWALPGGRMEHGETAMEAALREAREEINLELPGHTILGVLDDYPTRSGYLITPVVAWAPADAKMSPNPDEVARIHLMALTVFNRPGSPEFVSIPESDRPVVRYPVKEQFIHAPTAAVVYQFMEVAVHGRATRVAHLEQPVWAWR